MATNPTVRVALQVDGLQELERLEAGDRLELTADGRERRDLSARVELRQDAAGDGEGDGPVLEGIASVFDQEYTIGSFPWGFREKFAPGAFKAAIADADLDIVASFNHNADLVLGRQSAETLEVREGDKGLEAVIQPPDTTNGRDVVELVRRGDVAGMSITFVPTREEWKDGDPEKGELDLRTILEAKLYELGPVTFPASPTTSISARAEVASRLEARRRSQASDINAAAAERERRLALADADTVTLRGE